MTAGLSPSSSPILEYMTSLRNSRSQVPTSNFAAVRFVENEQFIRLSLDLPGVLAQDLHIELQHGVLMIRGIRELRLTPGYRHQHKFCRRFAIDTDVVNIERFQANLNPSGVLTIMAPKMGLPRTLQIAVTQQDDASFLASVARSCQQQAQELARDEDQENKANRNEDTKNNAVENDADEDEASATGRASLPNVVSMESATEVLENQAKTVVAVKRKHKASMKSHLMIRRSMRGKAGRNTRNATGKR